MVGSRKEDGAGRLTLRKTSPLRFETTPPTPLVKTRFGRSTSRPQSVVATELFSELADKAKEAEDERETLHDCVSPHALEAAGDHVGGCDVIPSQQQTPKIGGRRKTPPTPPTGGAAASRSQAGAPHHQGRGQATRPGSKQSVRPGSKQGSRPGSWGPAPLNTEAGSHTLYKFKLSSQTSSAGGMWGPNYRPTTPTEVGPGLTSSASAPLFLFAQSSSSTMALSPALVLAPPASAGMVDPYQNWALPHTVNSSVTLPTPSQRQSRSGNISRTTGGGFCWRVGIGKKNLPQSRQARHLSDNRIKPMDTAPITSVPLRPDQIDVVNPDDIPRKSRGWPEPTGFVNVLNRSDEADEGHQKFSELMHKLKLKMNMAKRRQKRNALSSTLRGETCSSLLPPPPPMPHYDPNKKGVREEGISAMAPEELVDQENDVAESEENDAEEEEGDEQNSSPNNEATEGCERSERSEEKASTNTNAAPERPNGGGGANDLADAVRKHLFAHEDFELGDYKKRRGSLEPGEVADRIKMMLAWRRERDSSYELSNAIRSKSESACPDVEQIWFGADGAQSFVQSSV